MIPHNRLTCGEEEAAAVSAVVRSGQWAAGARVRALEERLAALTGRQHAVATGSGLAALRLAMLAMTDSNPGKVIVPAYSCVALANAALASGNQVVAADVLAGSLCLDPARVRELLDENVAAIAAVHTFGQPAAINALRSTKPPVIEDCSHCLGIDFNGRPAGGHGDVAICSFYATKLVAGGEGGAVLTDDDGIAQFVREQRDYADQAPNATRLNDKMTDIGAALVLVQLARLPAMLTARRQLAMRYCEHLQPLAAEGLLGLLGNREPRVDYRFAVTVGDATRFISKLAEHGVCAAQPVEDWRQADQATSPNASQAYSTVVSLPLYPTLSRTEQDTVIRAVEQCLSS